MYTGQWDPYGNKRRGPANHRGGLHDRSRGGRMSGQWKQPYYNDFSSLQLNNDNDDNSRDTFQSYEQPLGINKYPFRKKTLSGPRIVDTYGYDNSQANSSQKYIQSNVYQSKSDDTFKNSSQYDRNYEREKVDHSNEFPKSQVSNIPSLNYPLQKVGRNSYNSFQNQKVMQSGIEGTNYEESHYSKVREEERLRMEDAQKINSGESIYPFHSLIQIHGIPAHVSRRYLIKIIVGLPLFASTKYPPIPLPSGFMHPIMNVFFQPQLGMNEKSKEDGDCLLLFEDQIARDLWMDANRKV